MASLLSQVYLGVNTDNSDSNKETPSQMPIFLPLSQLNLVPLNSTASPVTNGFAPVRIVSLLVAPISTPSSGAFEPNSENPSLASYSLSSSQAEEIASDSLFSSFFVSNSLAMETGIAPGQVLFPKTKSRAADLVLADPVSLSSWLYFLHFASLFLTSLKPRRGQKYSLVGRRVFFWRLD
ncbi:unnamed protein product [Protopolystoma xenopodis]|uniref:Uncharacterized protein n=1 Tax=Protopolystoma xenopodis TaxID=117903 RepID=A0A3S5CHG7_9PLAT|nr:unnamed protein product [Protopolystoma xenopodis]